MKSENINKALVELHYKYVVANISPQLIYSMYQIVQNRYLDYDKLKAYGVKLQMRRHTNDDLVYLSNHTAMPKQFFAEMCGLSRQALYREVGDHEVKPLLDEGHEMIFLFLKMITATFGFLYLDFGTPKECEGLDLTNDLYNSIIEHNFHTLLELFNFTFIGFKDKRNPILQFQQASQLLTVVDLPNRDELLNVYKDNKLNSFKKVAVKSLSTSLAICNPDTDFLWEKLAELFCRKYRSLSNQWWKFLKGEFSFHAVHRNEVDIMQNFLIYMNQTYGTVAVTLNRIRPDFWRELEEKKVK